jgi:hypothetical protein
MLCSDRLCTMLGFETARVSCISVRLGHDKRVGLDIPLVLPMARSLSCALGGGSGKDIVPLVAQTQCPVMESSVRTVVVENDGTPG